MRILSSRVRALRQDLFGQYLTSRVKNVKRPCTISNEYMLPETKPQECSCTENCVIRKQCLQAVLLSFSINIPIFQFLHTFSVLNKELHIIMMYVLNSPSFQLKCYQYLWSEFSKKNDKSVYLEALPPPSPTHIHRSTAFLPLVLSIAIKYLHAILKSRPGIIIYYVSRLQNSCYDS